MKRITNPASNPSHDRAERPPTIYRAFMAASDTALIRERLDPAAITSMGRATGQFSLESGPPTFLSRKRSQDHETGSLYRHMPVTTTFSICAGC